MSDLKQLRQQRRIHQNAVNTALGIIIILLFLGSLMYGKTIYSIPEIIQAISGNGEEKLQFAIAELRLPRASLAILVGICYGVAGVTFQTLLRNQLASPDIVGISAGAAAFASIAIVIFNLNQIGVSAAALSGALLTAAAIYLLAIKGTFSGTRMILIGIGLSSMLMSIVTYVLSVASAWNLATASRWLTGSLNGASWKQILPVLIITVTIIPLMLILRVKLENLQLGEDLARGLGIRTEIYRTTLIISGVIAVAVATSAAGPVAFVAFMSGPIALRLSKPGTVPVFTSGLIGALIMLTADFAGQYLFGARYPVGVITGMLGAPFLIYLLIRTQKGA